MLQLRDAILEKEGAANIKLAAQKAKSPAGGGINKKTSADLMLKLAAQKEKAAATAVEGGRSAVWQEVRRYVASDGRKTPCVFPDCESSAAGIRGLYHHFLTDHWEAFPPGTKLSVAGYLSLLIGWRTAGYTIREPAWLRVKALLPGLIDSLTVNE